MRSSWKTIALHFCARPKGNRKLRYLLESHPSSLPLSLQPLSFLTDFSLSLCSPPLSRALRAPPVSLLSIRNGSCFSPGDVEVCNPRMQPAPRTEGAGVSVRFAKREGQTERSIAWTCFRHPRILLSTYNRPISAAGARNTVACVRIVMYLRRLEYWTYWCLYTRATVLCAHTSICNA